MLSKAKKGQSILEYMLLLAVVLLVVLYGANTIIKARAKSNMDTAGRILDKARTELETATDTDTPAPAPGPGPGPEPV